MRFWSVARPNCAGLEKPSFKSTGMLSGMTSASTVRNCRTSSVLNRLLSCEVNACSGLPLINGVRLRSGSSQTMM
ncbi:hypothetical protein D3C85_1616830 [compost metagenome]